MAADIAQLVADLRINANILNPATKFLSEEPGWASIYSFETRDGQVVYRYDVEIRDLDKNESLTGEGDDGKLKAICFQVINTVHEKSQGFCIKNGNGGNVKALFVYDNRNIMYTNNRIDPFAIELVADMQPEFCRTYLRGNNVLVKIQPCKTDVHELALNDIKSALCSKPDEQANCSLRTFLELLTSQPFINAGTHVTIGIGWLFEKQPKKDLNSCLVLRQGIAKDVRFIANDGKNPCAALVADVKSCVYFREGNLEQIVRNFIHERRYDMQNPEQMLRFRDDFNELFKGISGTLTYAPSRVIVIESLTKHLMRDISFDINGKAISMVDFFASKNIKVNGDLPAVLQENDRETLFPITCINILPGQRLNIEKMTDNISRELFNANSINPAVRYQLIDQEVKKIGFLEGDSGKFMLKFGVKLKGKNHANGVDVPIGMRQLPKMKFGNGEFEPDVKNAQGRFADQAPTRYLHVFDKLASLKWMVAHPRRVARHGIEEFIRKLIGIAKGKGMILSEPIFETIELDSMESEFEKQRGLQFLMYVDFKNIKSHAPLKLYEKQFLILTQHLTFDQLQKAGIAYIDNVLNKMNMKLFGQNYMAIMDPIVKRYFDLESTLVIGLDTSIPSKETLFERFQMEKKGMKDLDFEDPMVVGICANYDKNPIKFNGDYYFQPCKQDLLIGDMLAKKMSWILNNLKQNKRKPPQTVFIIRDGVREGMLPNSVNEEFLVFEAACREFNQKWKPKFVFCILDKRHKRSFVRDGTHINNMMPGAVIDRKYIRPDLPAFYLQSHYLLKGCANTPQYVFPVYQSSAGMDELQSFILALCHMWQIVYFAPTLPVPVLQAKELAKRGRNNYMEMRRMGHWNMNMKIPRLRPLGLIDYDRLNGMLCYDKHVLSNTRFNA